MSSHYKQIAPFENSEIRGMFIGLSYDFKHKKVLLQQ